MGNIFKICSNVFDYCDNYLFEDKDDKDNNVFRSIIPSDESLELDLDELDGLAVMADTDNSKMKSIAYFQNIYFSAN